MAECEKIKSNLADIELWPWLEMVSQDGPRNPETIATLAEHKKNKQAFMDAKEGLIDRYERVARTLGHHDSGRIPWEYLTGWAFDASDFLSRNLYETVALNPEDEQAIHEISDLAFQVLSSHRLLAKTFSQLTQEDKKSLRPQEISIGWEPYDYLSRASADISGLVIGDAADRYIRWVFSGNDVKYENRQLYSDAIAEVLEVRSLCLTQPLMPFQRRLPHSRDDIEQAHVLRSYEYCFRDICGGARDNGDNVLWRVAARHLDPQRLMFANEHVLGMDADKMPKPRRYVTEETHKR